MARLWPIESTNEPVLFPHRGAVRHATFSPDGALVLTASTDKTARVWRAADGQPSANRWSIRCRCSTPVSVPMAARSPPGRACARSWGIQSLGSRHRQPGRCSHCLEGSGHLDRLQSGRHSGSLVLRGSLL